MLDPNAFKRVCANAGLKKGEVAKLYATSRQTIYAWLDGKLPRAGSPMDRMAAVITNVLCIMLDKRQLPLPAMAASARAERIARMAAKLQNIKPAPVK